ncbi:FliI/YscN family ATPase [Cognatishimia sp. MH4019]|uniref:FliI/YscN family ATPase n=1 Tax=Cognatishimia sp. MH4019 TaxID=2854030 RepID=UPI001CD210CE
MTHPDLSCLSQRLSRSVPSRRIGRVEHFEKGLLRVSGLNDVAALGDRLDVRGPSLAAIGGEVISLAEDTLTMLPERPLGGVVTGMQLRHLDPLQVAPHKSWLGRVIDPNGYPLDGRALMPGSNTCPIHAAPPLPATRGGFGKRLESGIAAFNTFLPIVEGQRIGLFAGSGVGKTSLLGDLAKGLESDICVIALIGERGRELRDFVDRVLGPDGMSRTIIVAATSDSSPLLRRQCAWTAVAVAEFFRNQGQHVLFLADSLTRFAEAHREIALASGEPASLRGYPPSTAHMLMSLCERLGPGGLDEGHITAVLSVLVAGSDMDEPIADIVRGVLDGHVVLDRKIAERGRFPAIDLLRSVSRSLPDAATASENALLTRGRALAGAYASAEMMVQAGLYAPGTDPLVDAAVQSHQSLDNFMSMRATVSDSFDALRIAIEAKGDVGAGDLPDG